MFNLRDATENGEFSFTHTKKSKILPNRQE